MKKVLIITTYLDEKSGWGRYSLDLIHSMMKNNVNITVICFKKNKNNKGVKQIELLPSPSDFRRNYFLAILYVCRVLYGSKLNFKKIDLIHCLIEPYAFFTFILSKITKKRYFLTLHGSFVVKPFINKFYGVLQSISYKNATKLIAISNYTKKRLLSYTSLNNIVVIPNGVNIEKFNSNSENLDKENIIISVGCVKFRKGYHLMIDVVFDIKQKIPDIKYYIIGNQSDQKYLGKLKNQILNLNLKDNVFFLQNLPEHDLKDMYKKAKIFAMTPVSNPYNFEGFGLVYLEANALGLPVVGSYGNGGEDAIEHKFNGFLVDINNSKNISDKIILLLKDDVLYKRMADNAKKWTEKFNWNDIAKKYIKTYE